MSTAETGEQSDSAQDRVPEGGVAVCRTKGRRGGGGREGGGGERGGGGEGATERARATRGCRRLKAQPSDITEFREPQTQVCVCLCTLLCDFLLFPCEEACDYYAIITSM